MIYFREKINSFTEVFDNCSVIVLVSQNYKLLQKDAQKISEEIEFLRPYLPTPMTEEDVRQIISEILSKMEKPHVGMIMKELSPQIKGKFDGKAANKIVQELMNKN